MRTLSPWLPALAAAVLLPVLGLAQGSDLGERVLALRQSLEKDQAALRKYEWIETTVVSYKGEEKSNAQKRCYYGADGVLQKVPVASSAADMPGGDPGQDGQAQEGRRDRVHAAGGGAHPPVRSSQSGHDSRKSFRPAGQASRSSSQDAAAASISATT